MADFITCFSKDPNGRDTLDEVTALYEEAEKRVHAEAKKKYGDVYQVGGDEYGNEIHALLMAQLASINLLDPVKYDDLLAKAEQWYVPFDAPEGAKCGAISAPLVAAIRDSRQIQLIEQLRKTCVACRDRVDSLIRAREVGDALSAAKFENALQIAKSQREMLIDWIKILEDMSLPADVRFERVQRSIAANKKFFVVTKNIPDDLRSQLADDSQQPLLFHNPFLICLQENMSWEATQEAIALCHKALKEARNSTLVPPLAPKEEKEKIAKMIYEKMKDNLRKILQPDIKGEDIEILKNGLAAWKVTAEGDEKNWCETIKEVMGVALEQCPYYEGCERLMNACCDYASELLHVVEDEQIDAKQRDVAKSKLVVVEALKETLNSQKLPSERLKDFTNLYHHRDSQRALNASSDTATEKFRKVVDSILLLFQKGGLQKISSLWHKAEGLLDKVDTATRSFLSKKK